MRVVRPLIGRLSELQPLMASFWREVARSKCLWALLDPFGQPVGITRKGATYRLLWSTSFRLSRAVTNHPSYANYAATKVSWQRFRDEWIPEMERNRELACMDFVRKRVFAFKPSVVKMLVEFEIQQIGDSGVERNFFT
jgi:hypothetical protein